MSDVVVRFPKIYKFLDEPYRYKVMYGGRGSGKSWTVARKLLIKGAEKPLLILCTRELQKSIKGSVHALLKNQIDSMGLGAFYEVLNTEIRGINGTRFIFEGVKHNVDEIKSLEGVDICWIEEGHNLTEASWDTIDPTIRKDGSEIWITYNTRFKFDFLHQHFVIKRAPDNARVVLVNHTDNPYLPAPLKVQMTQMQERDYEKYLHIWEGQLKELAEGAIFGKQVTETKRAGRRLYIPVQKNLAVSTFWDLGYNDETAIWFMQRVGMEHRLIDYFQGRLEEIAYYAKFIHSVGYFYERHYTPHDGKHVRLGMGKSINQQLEDANVRPIEPVDVTPDKAQAIQITRDMFPNLWFHKADDGDKPLQQCEGYLDWIEDESMQTRARRIEKGWEALSNYRYKYRDEDGVFSARPHHDWASNGADALIQLAQSYEYRPSSPKRKRSRPSLAAV